MIQFFNGMLTLLLAKFVLNDVPHMLLPEWFRHEYVKEHGKETEIHIGEWGGLASFYHITQRPSVPAILQSGLRVPRKREELLFVGGVEPVPGIYLQEDETLALDMASIMMERRPDIELSMLRVLLPTGFEFVLDPEVGVGAIVVLRDIPPGFISVVADPITSELIERVVEKGEEL